jgi:hypothetical protein
MDFILRCTEIHALIRIEDDDVFDALMIAVLLVSFAASAAYVRACARLVRSPGGAANRTP